MNKPIKAHDTVICQVYCNGVYSSRMGVVKNVSNHGTHPYYVELLGDTPTNQPIFAIFSTTAVRHVTASDVSTILAN